MKLLEGKTVAMTGGGGGLGLYYGVAMAKHGASIAVSDIESRRGAEDGRRDRQGRRQSVHRARRTSRSRASSKTLLDRTEAELGPLDVLLNIAGMFPRVALVDMTEDVWDKVMAHQPAQRLSSARAQRSAACCRANAASCVSTASGTGIRGQPKGSAYAASKAGDHRLHARGVARTQGHGRAHQLFRPRRDRHADVAHWAKAKRK